MLRTVLFIALLFPACALAQSADTDNMAQHHAMMSGHAAAVTPVQPGQGAFAAIQEIVGILEGDLSTDWSKVNIEALRRHLIDMDNVTLRSEVKEEIIEGGMWFAISGVSPVKDSIRRMVMAHAATMSGVDGWTFTAVATDDGARITVVVPAKDREKLRGLGFIGVMTRGMHHQAHHLMIARGGDPHL